MRILASLILCSLMHAVTVLCAMVLTCLTVDVHYLWLLDSLHLFFLDNFLSLRGRKCCMVVSAEHSACCYSLHVDQLRVSVSVCVLASNSHALCWINKRKYGVKPCW